MRPVQVTAHERTPDHTGGFLAGVRVIELSAGIAASFCGRLLADAGAEVIRSSRPTVTRCGRRVRSPAGALIPNWDCRSLCSTPASASCSTRRAPRTGDGWGSSSSAPTSWSRICRRDSLPPWGIDPHALAAAPGADSATISPFGPEGPYADFAATELTVPALGGLMPHRRLRPRADQARPTAGAISRRAERGRRCAQPALLAARDRDGRGQHVDVSMRESLTLLLAGREFPLYALFGGRGPAGRQGGTGTEQHHGLRRRLRRAADRRRRRRALGDYRPVPGGARPAQANRRWARWPQCVARGDRRPRRALPIRSRYEVFHGAQALGLPWGLVQSPADLVRCPQLEAHGFWAEVDHPVAGRLRLPGPAYRATRSPARVRAAAPMLGEHTAEVTTAAPPPRPAVGAAALRERKGRRSAAGGVRVVEAARVWAMPFADGLLTDMGAEVIKIETTGHLDQRVSEPYLHNDQRPLLGAQRAVPQPQPWQAQRDAQPPDRRGPRRLFRELVATADVVVENSRPGVLTRLGLDYAALSRIRPDLIMLSNSGYGQTGPGVATASP
ncbi:MAG: CoA transferase [Dehalococcoidia bacterium]